MRMTAGPSVWDVLEQEMVINIIKKIVVARMEIAHKTDGRSSCYRLIMTVARASDGRKIDHVTWSISVESTGTFIPDMEIPGDTPTRALEVFGNTVADAIAISKRNSNWVVILAPHSNDD